MSSQAGGTAWIALAITVLVLLFIDLWGHRAERSTSRRAAVVWTMVWIGAGLLFNVGVWVVMGATAAQEYLASYLIEKSLSVDNLFVFLIIFQSLKIPPRHQHQVLFWGIFGALVFRAIFVFAGAAALERYHAVAYVFGAILLYAAWRTLRQHPGQEKDNRAVKFLSRHLPVTHHTRDGAFVTQENGRRVVTPLLIALVAVELTDIVFAIDSVPAALSVSRDRFIVLSSNAFAILGLRALYTVLAQTLKDLRYLHYGLAGVLAFAAFKLVSSAWLEIPAFVSIGVIVVMIGAAVAASLRARKTRAGPADGPVAPTPAG